MSPPNPIAPSEPGRLPSAIPSSPRMSPLVPVVAPLVVAAIVIGFVLSRYSRVIAPPREAPAARFVDATAESGLAFRHGVSGIPPEELPTTLGSGLAVLDYDQDGAPDLFLVNASPWPWNEGAGEAPRCALYRNDGSGHFTDVTASTGTGLQLQGMGAASGDFDKDGWPDLFVTGVGEQRLLRNRGDGTFEDLTESAGLENDGQTWSSGALWIDLDRDGWLDLVVCRYARWPREVDLELAFKIAGVGRSYGAPAGFVSASPAVYRNLGGGRFAEIGEQAGLRNLESDTRLPRFGTLGAAALDQNDDGRVDLLFFHHAGPPALFLNQGGGRFQQHVEPGRRQEGEAAGLLGLGAMPLDLLRAGHELQDALRVLASRRDGAFAGLPSKLGLALVDYDLDGRPDVFSGGGRIEPELNRFEAGRGFENPPLLLWNGRGGWRSAVFPPGSALDEPVRLRGLASVDVDGDGDEDVVASQSEGPVRLYRNEQRSGAAWLRIHLVGTRSCREGYGARVEVQTPRQRLVRHALPTAGYLSQGSSDLTFGLGEDARVRRVVVRWPDGGRQEVVPEGVSRVLTIVEPR